jgi:DHA2 family multidrug resistance protein
MSSATLDLASLAPEQVPLNSALRAEGRVVGPKWTIAIVAMVGALVAVLDVSIVNVSLPSIRASLGATLQDTAWIATAYMVSNIVIIPMTGFFQRRIGFRAYFMGSLVLFTVASLLCATSWSLWSIVVFRALQGLGGGALIPTASSIMMDRFPRSERNMAMAIFGLGAMLGPLLGPSLGGWLTDQFSWHMIFLINLPIGIIELFLVSAYLREDRSGIQQEPIDWWGIAYLIGWLASMQYVLEEGNNQGWFQEPRIRWFTLLSFASFLLFIENELRVAHPLVKLRYFLDRQYTTGTIINMGLGLSLFGGIYLFSLYAGVVLNYTASTTGGLIFWAALLQGLTMPLIGRFGGLVDKRVLLGFGMTMMLLSLYQYTRFTGQEGWWNLLFPQLLRACGMGAVFISVGTLALDSIPSTEVGDATGLFSLTRELGGSIGTAMLATLLTRRAVVHGAYLSEPISSLSSVATARMNATAGRMTQFFGDPTHGSDAAIAIMKGQVARQALVLAFDDAFAVATAIGAVLILVILTMKRPRAVGPAPAGGH